MLTEEVKKEMDEILAMQRNKNKNCKDFKKIFTEFKKCKGESVNNYRVAIAVYTIIDCWDYFENCSNKEFEGLCNIVKSIWINDDDMPNECMEPIALVVCDCYFDLERGFYNEDTKIEKSDFKSLDEDKEWTLRLAVKKYLRKAIKTFKI